MWKFTQWNFNKNCTFGEDRNLTVVNWFKQRKVRLQLYCVKKDQSVRFRQILRLKYDVLMSSFLNWITLLWLLVLPHTKTTLRCCDSRFVKSLPVLLWRLPSRSVISLPVLWWLRRRRHQWWAPSTELWRVEKSENV